MTAILLTVTASFLWAVAAVLQKHGMSSSFPKISAGTLFRDFGKILVTLARNWLWLLGVLIGLIGGGVYTQGVSMGDMSVLLPLINLQMVFAIGLGILFLGERLQPNEWIGVGIMIVGAVVISLAGGAETSVNPPSATMYLFNGAIIALLLAMAGAYFVTGRRIPVEVILATGAGLIFGLGNMLMKVLTFVAEERLGAFNVLDSQTWMVVLLSLPALLLAVYEVAAFILLQAAFSHGRVALVNPIASIFSVFVPVLAAVAIFQEKVDAKRWVGIAIILAGTAVLAARREEQTGDEGDTAPQDADAARAGETAD